MKSIGFWVGIAVGAIATCVLSQWELFAASKMSDAAKCVPAETVAEHVHAVIQADRKVYTTEVVERMQLRGVVVASENWRERGTLPLPAQFMSEAAQVVREARSGIRFRLISNWAINKRNRPATEFERTGLSEILVSGGRPYTGLTTEGATRYFQAIYPDRAVSQTCVACHNAHPESPKKDFKLSDVMGGVLLMIPLPQ